MPNPYRVQILKGAQRDLASFEPAIRLQILTKMKVLEVDPFPRGQTAIKILRGFRPPLLRLRSGDFRIVYRISQDVVNVLAVVNRKELERRLERIRE